MIVFNKHDFTMHMMYIGTRDTNLYLSWFQHIYTSIQKFINYKVSDLIFCVNFQRHAVSASCSASCIQLPKLYMTLFSIVISKRLPWLLNDQNPIYLITVHKSVTTIVGKWRFCRLATSMDSPPTSISTPINQRHIFPLLIWTQTRM